MALGAKTVVFKCEAVGTPPLEYLWKFNGERMKDKTENTLKINNITRKEEGHYQCCVKNKYDWVPSDSAELRIGKVYM